MIIICTSLGLHVELQVQSKHVLLVIASIFGNKGLNFVSQVYAVFITSIVGLNSESPVQNNYALMMKRSVKWDSMLFKSMPRTSLEDSKTQH